MDFSCKSRGQAGEQPGHVPVHEAVKSPCACSGRAVNRRQRLTALARDSEPDVKPHRQIMDGVCQRRKSRARPLRGYFLAAGRQLRLRGIPARRRGWRAMDAGAVLFRCRLCLVGRGAGHGRTLRAMALRRAGPDARGETAHAPGFQAATLPKSRPASLGSSNRPVRSRVSSCWPGPRSRRKLAISIFSMLVA